MFARWTNYLCWLLALASLAGTLNVITDASAWFTICLIGLLLFSVWDFEVSWDLERTPAES